MISSIPITGSDKDGSFHLVFMRDQAFALARWDGREWLHRNGEPIGFEPTHRAVTEGNADG